MHAFPTHFPWHLPRGKTLRPSLQHLQGWAQPFLGRMKGKLRHTAVSPGLWINPRSPACPTAASPRQPAQGRAPVPPISPRRGQGMLGSIPMPGRARPDPAKPPGASVVPAAVPAASLAPLCSGPGERVPGSRLGFLGCVGGCSEPASEGQRQKIPSVTSFLPTASSEGGFRTREGVRGGGGAERNHPRLQGPAGGR